MISGVPSTFARSRSDSTAYSSRSRDRVEPQDRSLRARLQLGEADAQRSVGARFVAPDGESSVIGGVVLRPRRVGVGTEAAQPDVVGVRVEDDDPQVRLGEHLLEQEARASRSCRSRTGHT